MSREKQNWSKGVETIFKLLLPILFTVGLEIKTRKLQNEIKNLRKKIIEEWET